MLSSTSAILGHGLHRLLQQERARAPLLVA